MSYNPVTDLDPLKNGHYGSAINSGRSVYDVRLPEMTLTSEGVVETRGGGCIGGSWWTQAVENLKNSKGECTCRKHTTPIDSIGGFALADNHLDTPIPVERLKHIARVQGRRVFDNLFPDHNPGSSITSYTSKASGSSGQTQNASLGEVAFACGVAYLSDSIKLRVLQLEKEKHKANKAARRLLRDKIYNCTQNLANLVKSLNVKQRVLAQRILKVMRGETLYQRDKVGRYVLEQLQNPRVPYEPSAILKYLYKGISPFKEYTRSAPRRAQQPRNWRMHPAAGEHDEYDDDEDLVPHRAAAPPPSPPQPRNAYSLRSRGAPPGTFNPRDMDPGNHH